MMASRFPIIAFAFALFAGITTSGQSVPNSAALPTISVPLFIGDAHDKPVAGVAITDLSILDNKKAPQRLIALRGRTELRLRLGVVIDTSNSERSGALYQAAVQAASDLLNQVLSNPDDKVFIEKFDVLPNATEFMTKTQLASFKLDLTPAGPTALYDALRFACDERIGRDAVPDSLRVIVLLSDGGDNQSHITRKEAIASAQRASAVIFAVSTADDNAGFGLGDAKGNVALKQFADETGGLAFLHLSKKDVPKVFATIRDQIENMYVLSYVASDASGEGQYRTLELKSDSKTKTKLRAPKGYYGRTQSISTSK